MEGIKCIVEWSERRDETNGFAFSFRFLREAERKLSRRWSYRNEFIFWHFFSVSFTLRLIFGFTVMYTHIWGLCACHANICTQSTTCRTYSRSWQWAQVERYLLISMSRSETDQLCWLILLSSANSCIVSIAQTIIIIAYKLFSFILLGHSPRLPIHLALPGISSTFFIFIHFVCSLAAGKYIWTIFFFYIYATNV